MSTLTIVLAVALVGAVVYFVGVDRTTDAATEGAQKTKRSVKRTAGLALAGGSMGLATGDALVGFLAGDPATLIAAFIGGLGIASLGGIVDFGPVQYALVVGVLLVAYGAWQSEDD